MKDRFNLSDWALEHRSLVWFFIIVSAVAGVFAYMQLGREEDPSFTIKTMVIVAQWPGATVEDTARQVTERIEKKLEELDSLDYTKSQTTAGQTTVYVNLKDTTKSRDVPGVWVKVRNMINDIKAELPARCRRSLLQRRLRRRVRQRLRLHGGWPVAAPAPGLCRGRSDEILTVPNIGKVNLIGAQDEVIFLEFSTREIAALGISQQDVVRTLQAQNAITPSGVIEAGPERVSIRVTGQFSSEESLRNLNLRINDRFFRLADIATITRGYVDPPQSSSGSMASQPSALPSA